MSQIWIRSTGGLPPGSDIQTITPDEDIGGGPGIPVGPDGSFNINLTTGTGLTSIGDPATSTIVLSIDGFIEDTVTTNGLQTKTAVTVPSSNSTVTHFDCIIAGYATPIIPGAATGFGGSISATFITVGGVATEINSPDVVVDSFASTTCTFTCSGAGTNILVQVTGDVAYNIVWTAKVNYTFSP